MSKIDLRDLTRKMDALSNTYRTLPKELGAIAVNFSKERFINQAWLDSTKENWQPRKRSRRSVHNKKTTNQTLLVQTGRLKKSIRVISADESKIIVGSDVPYAQIQNDGGVINKTVNVKQHDVKQHSRKRNGRDITVKEHSVKAHTRKMNTTIPSRRFLGASYTLSKRMMNLITARFVRALKS